MGLRGTNEKEVAVNSRHYSDRSGFHGFTNNGLACQPTTVLEKGVRRRGLIPAVLAPLHEKRRWLCSRVHPRRS
jgi:hypothetical protein